MQGPEPYLATMGAALPCAVHPAEPALLDPAHRAFVNHEVYYVGSDEALAAFGAEPWVFTGPVTDPVSLRRFVPGADSPQRAFEQRLFFFETAEAAETFDADPATYRVPRPMMRARE